MAEIAKLRTSAETGLTRLFEVARTKHVPGTPIAREEAFRTFEALGLPTRRVEAFKYTDLRAAMKEAAPPAEA
ncbi:Fe-S cluster assembly protein SufD, partial [Methylobacterium trifolii]